MCAFKTEEIINQQCFQHFFKNKTVSVHIRYIEFLKQFWLKKSFMAVPLCRFFRLDSEPFFLNVLFPPLPKVTNGERADPPTHQLWAEFLLSPVHEQPIEEPSWAVEDWTHGSDEGEKMVIGYEGLTECLKNIFISFICLICIWPVWKGQKKLSSGLRRRRTKNTCLPWTSYIIPNIYI